MCTGSTIDIAVTQGGRLCSLVDDDLPADYALRSHANDIFCCRFSPTGAGTRNAQLPLQLATASGDCRVKVWDCSSGRLVHVLAEHRKQVYGCAWSPEGGLLATVGMDHRLILWRASDGQRLRAYDLASAAFDVAWHPGGKHVAVACRDRCAMVIRVLKRHESA